MTLSQFPRRKIRGVSEVVESMQDLIRKNIVAKTNVTSDVTTGSNVVSVENTFHFRPGEEIILIDYGYGDTSHQHYDIFEYAKIEEINNTTSMTLTTNVEGNWTTTDRAFVQKTIGHSPLHEHNVYYGDREVIPLEQIAVTIEPVSMSNEWLYIQGGLSEEYRFQITIYGKSIKMDEGKIILDKYADNIYRLLNENMHFDVSDYSVPILYDVVSNTSSVVIEDTPENRKQFVTDPETYSYFGKGHYIQDNYNSRCGNLAITNVASNAGELTITFDQEFGKDFSVSNFAYLRRKDRYFYDSRVDSITYGEIQKGSAILRAAQLSWFGKWVNDFTFPQPSSRVY